MSFKRLFYIIAIMSLLGLNSCGTYYQKTQATEHALVMGDYTGAIDHIQESRFLKKKRNRLLFYLEMGKACHLNKQFKESNAYLNLADDLMEEHRNILEMAVGVTVNPAVQPYQAEAHERIYIHYYKALNYLQLGNIEDALVEARRLNLKQNELDIDRHGKLNKYGKDPFGMLLMGMIYEADGDFNNAFIAYRNAKEIYEEDQTGLYQNKMPISLEYALVRCSKITGIGYESDLDNSNNSIENGELILFWENGLAPIKQEQNMLFSLEADNNGAFFFTNGNMNVPANYDFKKDNPNFNPASLGTIRVAYAHYIPRINQPTQPLLTVNGKSVNFEKGADITGMAFQIEKDNYFKNLAENLLRLALKKISEAALHNQNEFAGMALSVTNSFTEKADTRNWQTLPSSIDFVRIPLQKGMNEIVFSTPDGTEKTLIVEGKGGMVFKNIVTY